MARAHARIDVQSGVHRVYVLDLPLKPWVEQYRKQLATRKIDLRTELPPMAHPEQYAETYNAVSVSAVDRLAGFDFLQHTRNAIEPISHFVFVIDASGSMLSDLPFATREVAVAIDRLTIRHEVTILFYQNGDFIELETRGRQPARLFVKTNLRDLIVERHVVPQGSSDPYKALERGCAIMPNQLYWISNGLGLHQYEEDRQLLTTTLKRLYAQYRIPIHTIKLRTRDQQHTMERIADSTKGIYRFVSEKDLGIDGK